MKIYLNHSVLDAALNRIRWIYDQFDVVVVSSSGGKDSTVILNLALQVAEEKNRLPVPVLFVDQEAEWQATIDYMRQCMDDPRVQPLWFQAPIRLFNATSTADAWLECWEPGKEWIRAKEPDSIHVNEFGTRSFKDSFAAITNMLYSGRSMAQLTGIRVQESPARRRGMTTAPTYKWVTWGKRHHKPTPDRPFHGTLSPIYDWEISDVWKAIHDHGWAYNRLYDYMYQYGIPIREMRVSNVHHETAVTNLWFLPEIEPETWARVTRRLSGTNTANQMQTDFMKPKTLPWMFSSWVEYRDFLLERLIENPEHKARFRKFFAQDDAAYIPEIQPKAVRTHIQSILVNDYHGTKIETFRAQFNIDRMKIRRMNDLPVTGKLTGREANLDGYTKLARSHTNGVPGLAGDTAGDS